MRHIVPCRQPPPRPGQCVPDTRTYPPIPDNKKGLHIWMRMGAAAARPHQRGGRVDHVGYRLQPARALPGVEFLCYFSHPSNGPEPCPVP